MEFYFIETMKSLFANEQLIKYLKPACCCKKVIAKTIPNHKAHIKTGFIVFSRLQGTFRWLPYVLFRHEFLLIYLGTWWPETCGWIRDAHKNVPILISTTISVWQIKISINIIHRGSCAWASLQGKVCLAWKCLHAIFHRDMVINDNHHCF